MQAVQRVVEEAHLHDRLMRHDTLLPEQQAKLLRVQVRFVSRGQVVCDRNGGVGGGGRLKEVVQSVSVVRRGRRIHPAVHQSGRLSLVVVRVSSVVFGSDIVIVVAGLPNFAY